jgi:hypothetical protein
VRTSGAAEINAQAGNLNIVPEARLGPADATQEKHESVVQNVQMTPESAVESDPAESLDLPQTV